MTPQQKQLDALLKRTGRTLQLSAAVLPADVRWVFTIAYLFCRCADTVADTDLIAQDKKILWIKEIPSLFTGQDGARINALVSELNHASVKQSERELLQSIELCIKVFNEFDGRDKELIMGIVKKVCEGMLFDLEHFDGSELKGLQKQTELEYYCDTMGGAPGVFWSELILKSANVKIDNEEFIKLGRSIGNALQIVNILRDFDDDINIGRVYFPHEDMEALGLSFNDLKGHNPAAKKLLHKWILWGAYHIKDAAIYYSAIPKTNWRFRISVAWPIIWTLDNFVLLSQYLKRGGGRLKLRKFDIYKTILASPLYMLSDKYFENMVNKRTSLTQETIKNTPS